MRDLPICAEPTTTLRPASSSGSFGVATSLGEASEEQWEAGNIKPGGETVEGPPEEDEIVNMVRKFSLAARD
ncbi:hypothetical protein SLA2020_275980 [Shorea laevis]